MYRQGTGFESVKGTGNESVKGTEFASVRIEAPNPTSMVVFQSTILKEIRSWAISLLILGILSIFASGFLSAPWGILLIFVGLASFYFRSSAMLVVYAVTLAWAGISNAISGQALWIAFAIFQWFLVVRVFQKFLSFRRVEVNSAAEESGPSGLTPKRTTSIFPWAAGALGAFSLMGLIGIFIAIIIQVIFIRNQAVPGFLNFIESLVVNCGVLGFAVGLASVLCKYPRRAVAIVGMVTGVLTLLVEIILKIV
jgi:hypothetical protein